jgi:hypothetical protein
MYMAFSAPGRVWGTVALGIALGLADGGLHGPAGMWTTGQQALWLLQQQWQQSRGPAQPHRAASNTPRLAVRFMTRLLLAWAPWTGSPAKVPIAARRDGRHRALPLASSYASYAPAPTAVAPHRSNQRGPKMKKIFRFCRGNQVCGQYRPPSALSRRIRGRRGPEAGEAKLYDNFGLFAPFEPLCYRGATGNLSYNSSQLITGFGLE